MKINLAGCMSLPACLLGEFERIKADLLKGHLLLLRCTKQHPEVSFVQRREEESLRVSHAVAIAACGLLYFCNAGSVCTAAGGAQNQDRQIERTWCAACEGSVLSKVQN